MAANLISEQVPMIRAAYERMAERVAEARKLLGRPLTLAEKILFSHAEGLHEAPVRGETYVKFRPDRVAMQDATAQMAILQFMLSGRDKVAVPSTVHCDHLIRAEEGVDRDLPRALDENREVYEFLRSASEKYGIGFWKPGAGIIHQIVLENYAFPGGMMIGTDSHTPNAGGMGMVAIGVGGADAADVMAGLPWSLRWPRLIGVHLKGKISGWTAPKDIILRVAEILTVKGGTGHIVEYFGEGVASLSLTGRATVTNMGAEIGATCSLFPFDGRTARYLEMTGREEIARLAEAHAADLAADREAWADPEKFYDQVIEIDLDELEPHIVGPHTPDLGRPVSALGREAKENGWPLEVTAGLVGSCTNSSYEDLGRAAHVARQALAAGIRPKASLWISPGSEQVYATAKRDGLLEPLEQLGAKILAFACGPCIGQWKRHDIEEGQPNSIVTSFNRNFPRRNDGNPGTHAFIASPEIVIALALAGTLDADPVHGEIQGVKLEPPVASELPEKGFEERREGYVPPREDGSSVQVIVREDSERLQLLSPFPEWDGKDFERLPVLLKAKGKCTTDHISPAGPWLRYRGHLDRISNNMFLGANNAFTGETGTAINVLTGEKAEIPRVARAYKEAGIGWVVIGDENYGEGSSREHAAMEPRYLGAKAVIARSFARIHETNLKKQGVLALTFADPADYDRIGPEDRVSIVGLADLAPGKPVTVVVHHPDGSEDRFLANHSYTEEELEWFRAGSALNYLRKRNRG